MPLLRELRGLFLAQVAANPARESRKRNVASQMRAERPVRRRFRSSGSCERGVGGDKEKNPDGKEPSPDRKRRKSNFLTFWLEIPKKSLSFLGRSTTTRKREDPEMPLLGNEIG